MSLGIENARHLLLRTGFGGRPAEVEAFAGLRRRPAVQRLLNGVSSELATGEPAFMSEPVPGRAERREMGRDFQMMRRQWSAQLKEWWYLEMLSTEAPLTERLVLFWHNHFTSGLRKVRMPQLMYRQQLIFREFALGNFREMLHRVATDPAMLVYLDGANSDSEHPNENFARELFELFTLGEGHYSEDDIREAARAFTGWTLERDRGEFRRAPRRHDFGAKTLFGRTGTWDGHDVIDIVLEQERTAVHIVAKLWRELVGDVADPAEIDRIATRFRESGYEIRTALSALLQSDAFWSDENRANRVKSPVELLVGTCRNLELNVDRPRQLVRAGRALGQDIFDPPNVKGWDGGTAWITTSSLMQRQAVLREVVRRPEVVFRINRGGLWLEPEQLLARPPVYEIVGRSDFDRLEAILSDPAYQLS